ncbi:hypothetical protein [Frigidibacter sp. SD6-1]|uniref:hypothetical protein n=1 Tax=Frigidibacter sp. SD6-1 TaxID=3032581 RepID=UPI0024DF5514|nr:hypothetical protein [Frigidibacter sp. SD6-1]
MRRIFAILLALTVPVPCLADFPLSPETQLAISRAPFNSNEVYTGGSFIFVIDEDVKFKGKVRYKHGMAFDAEGNPLSDDSAVQAALRNIQARSGCKLAESTYIPAKSLAFVLECRPGG